MAVVFIVRHPKLAGEFRVNLSAREYRELAIMLDALGNGGTIAATRDSSGVTSYSNLVHTLRDTYRLYPSDTLPGKLGSGYYWALRLRYLPGYHCNRLEIVRVDAYQNTIDSVSDASGDTYNSDAFRIVGKLSEDILPLG